MIIFSFIQIDKGYNSPDEVKNMVYYQTVIQAKVHEIVKPR